MRERTVGASAARALVDFAVSKGADRAMLAERSGIATPELWDSDNRIAFDRYAALLRAAKDLSNDPAFALHFGEADEGAEASAACMLGAFSPTMSETFAKVTDDAPLVIGGLQFVREGDQLWIADTSECCVESTEASFARTVCTARRLFPGRQFVKAIQFTHGEPPYRAEYDRIFRMPLVFGSDHNALLTDAAWLQWKPRADSARSRVEALLSRALQTADIRVEAIARQLGMSRHTLFRRLRAEGVTFEQVLQELREKLATEYLNDRRLAVSETAYLLGFSDPAAFSRAYKRWTGHSPGAPVARRPGSQH